MTGGPVFPRFPPLPFPPCVFFPLSSPLGLCWLSWITWSHFLLEFRLQRRPVRPHRVQRVRKFLPLRVFPPWLFFCPLAASQVDPSSPSQRTPSLCFNGISFGSAPAPLLLSLDLGSQPPQSRDPPFPFVLGTTLPPPFSVQSLFCEKLLTLFFDYPA